MPYSISSKALDLVARQHKMILAAIPTRAKPASNDLSLYTSTFTKQFGIPYSYRLLELYGVDTPLEKEDFHPF